MKYVVVLGDGMADYHKGVLGNRTPLELAKKPCIDELAKKGQVGLIRTIDQGMNPGSDVANLSVIGYDPRICYTGRSPLEALSIGVKMDEGDTVLRMNLVTLSDKEKLEECEMVDYSAGEITTEEGHQLIKALIDNLCNGCMEMYGGTSYRNCAVLRGSSIDVDFVPPHDITGKIIKEYLPSGGAGKEIFINLIDKSREILSKHPINKKRIAEGKNPANAIWFWGKGSKPKLDSFYEKYGLKGAMISAVDLLKGIAIASGMTVLNVEGATGTLTTNFMGKAKKAVEALKEYDYVYLHMEAPDECGHQGDAEGKIKAIEKIDEVVCYILQKLREQSEEFCMAILPDHATPLCLKTHVSDPVPFIVYNSVREANSGLIYNENEAQKGLYLNNGRSLLQLMLKS